MVHDQDFLGPCILRVIQQKVDDYLQTKAAFSPAQCHPSVEVLVRWQPQRMG